MPRRPQQPQRLKAMTMTISSTPAMKRGKRAVQMTAETRMKKKRKRRKKMRIFPF